MKKISMFLVLCLCGLAGELQAAKYKVYSYVESGKGKITGAGTYKSGAKVTLRAKPSSGYVFAGWEWSVEDQGTIRSFEKNARKTSVAFKMPKEPVEVYGYFISKKSDWVELSVESGDWYVYGGQGDGETLAFGYGSGSCPTVSVSGLPKGVVKSGNTLKVSKLSSLKPGVHTVKITVKNLSGKKETRKVRIHAPNRTTAVDKELLNLNTDNRYGYRLTAGFRTDLQELDIYAAEGWEISASGLPPGLKWNASKQTLTGVPSKSGTYTATFKVTKGRKSYSATATFVIDPMPLNIAGTYTGYTAPFCDSCSFENDCGASHEFGDKSRLIKVSVSSGGKVTAKVGSISFSKTGISEDGDGYSVSLTSSKKSGKKTYSYALNLRFYPSESQMDCRLTGKFFIWYCEGGMCVSGWTNPDPAVQAWRNPFGKNSDGSYKCPEAGKIAKAFAGLKSQGLIVSKISSLEYELACRECIMIPPGVKPSMPLKAKVSSSGVVTLSGKFAGKPIKATSVLQPSGGYSWFARFVVKLDSKRTAYIELEYYIDEYGAYAPNGRAVIKKK